MQKFQFSEAEHANIILNFIILHICFIDWIWYGVRATRDAFDVGKLINQMFTKPVSKVIKS